MMHNHLVRKLTQKLDLLDISDYHGLSSPGLTCYLNSVLQVLFMTEDFREAVKENKYPTNLDAYLAELFIQLERRMGETKKITEKLGITNVIKQRDAAEYLEKILCLTSPEASKVFKGELNHVTRCSGCKSMNDSKNFFWVLPLAMECPDQKVFRVKQGFKSFFESQTVEGENQMYCDSCNKKQNASTECEMTQCPDVLTLLLKRFTFSHRKNCYVKLNVLADVSKTLHVKECRYDLYAVVHHFGDLSGGHYTAEIKSFETGQWYCFNDRIVKKVKLQYFEVEDHMKRSHTAYLLMYKKAKVRGHRKETGSRNPGTQSIVKAKENGTAAEIQLQGKKLLNGDNEELSRKETRTSDDQFQKRETPKRQPLNILPTEVSEINKILNSKHKLRENPHFDWLMRQYDQLRKGPNRCSNTHPSDANLTRSRVNTPQPAGVNKPCKPSDGVSAGETNSKPRRSRSLSRTNDSSKPNSFPHSHRRSNSLQRSNMTTQPVADRNAKERSLQAGMRREKSGKKCSDTDQRPIWR